MDPVKTVIVIRSLVPNGVAEQDGRLLPGDRLMYVNSTDLENASLEDAVQALKGAKLGMVQIGVAKPLPVRPRRSFITFRCFKPEYIRWSVIYAGGERIWLFVLNLQHVRDLSLHVCAAVSQACFKSCNSVFSHEVSAYESLNFSCRKRDWLAWLSFPLSVLSKEVAFSKMLYSLLFYIILLSNFPRAQTLLLHLNTPAHLSKYLLGPTACSQLQAPVLCKTSCILSAFELNRSRIERPPRERDLWAAKASWITEP